MLFIHHFTEKFSGSLAKGQNLQVPLLGSASSNLPLTAPSLVPPFSPLHHPPVQLKAFLPMVPVVPAMLLSFSTCPSPPHIQPFSTQTLLSIPEWSPNVQNQVSGHLLDALSPSIQICCHQSSYFPTSQPTQLPFSEKLNFSWSKSMQPHRSCFLSYLSCFRLPPFLISSHKSALILKADPMPYSTHCLLLTLTMLTLTMLTLRMLTLTMLTSTLEAGLLDQSVETIVDIEWYFLPYCPSLDQ